MCINIFLLFSFILANAELTSAVPEQNDSEIPLHCFEESSVKQEKKDYTYSKIRELFAKNNITPEETIARLIYSETRAAGKECQNHDLKISQYIGNVLMNRFVEESAAKSKKKFDKQDIESVIFKPKQFASSLHHYKESHIQDFLCPQNDALWTESLSLAQKMVAGTSASALPKNTMNYYLYKHSTRFKPPSWTKTLEEAKIKETALKPCIRFFKINKS